MVRQKVNGSGRAMTVVAGNRGVDSADLAVAATAIALDAQPFTRNIKHFPTFNGLSAPY